jgi:hypothetical protein
MGSQAPRDRLSECDDCSRQALLKHPLLTSRQHVDFPLGGGVAHLPLLAEMADVVARLKIGDLMT